MGMFIVDDGLFGLLFDVVLGGIYLKQVQILRKMDLNEMELRLRSSELNLDNATLTHALNFLAEHVGSLDPQLEQYQLMAATAIAGETVVIDDITLTRRARSGITLERVMRHLGPLSKEEYLSVLAKQVERWREAPLWLKAKAQNLRVSFRIYKKYLAVVEQLGKGNALLEEQVLFRVTAIFWLVFLFLKNQHPQFDNTLASTALLHAILVFAFAEVADSQPHYKPSGQFRKQFPESKLPAGSEWVSLRRMIIEKLEETHNYRYMGKPFELSQLVNNPTYEQRFLDDLSNQYEKFKSTLPQNAIDELSFLELTKNIAPQPVHRSTPQTTACIDTRIDFSKSSDQEDCFQEEPLEPPPPPQQPKLPIFQAPIEKPPMKEELKRVPLSPIRPLEGFMGSATPVTARHRNLSWVSGIISGKYVEEEAAQVELLYQKYARKDYSAYRKAALLSITNAIVEFTPDCMDVPRRQRSIYRFFQHFINRIAQSHMENDLAAILQDDQNINAILCLSCQLFNFAYQALSGAYRNCCKLFGVSLLQGYKPVNWFGKHVRMPRSIEDYLYQLQRRILIEELWEENEGYELLADQEELKKYYKQAALKRLHRHAGERTQELCKLMKVGEAETGRVVNLVKLVIDKLPILLKNHRIDQMIVCSIASVLSINRGSTQLSLEEIFTHYNKLVLSYNANRHSLFDAQGNQIGLIDFYNLVFLPAVEQLLDSPENNDFLATPVRIERSRGRELGLEMTPLSLKFRQPPALVIPGRRISLQGEERQRQQNEWGLTNSYRYELASSLKNLDEFPEEKDQEDQAPSPTFGGTKPPDIYRTFSFGEDDGRL